MGFLEAVRGRWTATPNSERGALNTRNRRRWGEDERDAKDRAWNPQIMDSARNSSILPIRSAPRGSLGIREPFSGRWTSTPNTQRGDTKYAEPPHMGRRRKENKRPAHGPVKFRIIFVIPPFYRSVAFRGSSGRLPAGGGHKHPTPDAGALSTRNRRIFGDDERNTRTGHGSLKFRILVVIPTFYRPAVFRGFPRGRRKPFRWRLTSTPDIQRGGTKYAKPP